jgi:poly(hydroxyalkanoate) depolymerase family esterase
MKSLVKLNGLVHGGSLSRLCQTALEVVVTLTAALLLAATTTGAVAGTTGVPSFGSNPGNLRMFKYVPNLRATPALVVALHGCLQSASAYDDETGWTQFADKWGFALLLPEQKNDNNSIACFNWFLPGDIERDKGEALSIKQMIDKMKTDHTIDPRRIYVTGLSAGGAMTAVMLATYPEIFAGGAIIAGLPYKCATTVNEARNSCMQPGKNLSPSEWGNRVRRATNNAGPWPKVSIWQGDADPTVNPMNATELMEQWTDVHGIDQIPEVQDAIKGYPHKAYQDANGNALVETYSITGMGHGTPVDPKGSGEDQCGKASAFILDKKICSSYYIAKFWGLDRIDQEAPSISITAPVDGAEVSGVIAIRADAKDNAGVTKIEFYVDGRLRETDTAAPWEASWDIAREAKGTHTLLAKAFDAAGNVGSSNPISVKGGGVDDITSPTVNLTSPKNGDTVGGTVTLAAQANDDFGVSRVEFLGLWELPWDTPISCVVSVRRLHNLSGLTRCAGTGCPDF